MPIFASEYRDTPVVNQAQVVDLCFFFFQAEDGIRDHCVTGVQTCALPIYVGVGLVGQPQAVQQLVDPVVIVPDAEIAGLKAQRLAHVEEGIEDRSEEHTSELQSHSDLVCRLLLEKKKKKDKCITHT